MWSRLLLFYQMFKNGFLPDSGAVIDQSRSLLETLRLMDEVNNECDRQIAEKERKKRARAASSPAAKRKKR